MGLVTVLRYRQSNIGNTQIPAIHGGVVGALLEHAAILHLLVETEVEAIPKIINLFSRLPTSMPHQRYLCPGRGYQAGTQGC